MVRIDHLIMSDYLEFDDDVKGLADHVIDNPQPVDSSESESGMPPTAMMTKKWWKAKGQDWQVEGQDWQVGRDWQAEGEDWQPKEIPAQCLKARGIVWDPQL